MHNTKPLSFFPFNWCGLLQRERPSTALLVHSRLRRRDSLQRRQEKERRSQRHCRPLSGIVQSTRHKAKLMDRLRKCRESCAICNEKIECSLFRSWFPIAGIKTYSRTYSVANVTPVTFALNCEPVKIHIFVVPWIRTTEKNTFVTRWIANYYINHTYIINSYSFTNIENSLCVL